MSVFLLRFWQVRDRHVHQRRRVVQPESVVVVDSGRPPTATVDDAGGGAGGGGDRVSVVLLFSVPLCNHSCCSKAQGH